MKRVMVAAALAALSLVAASAPATAANSWNGYHWRRSTNWFTLDLGSDVGPGWRPYLDRAAADWGRSSVVNTAVVAGRTVPGLCRPTRGRVEVCNDRSGANGWLGLASVWLDGAHIVQATVRLNDTYFATSDYDHPVVRQHVMCQELGHVLGLAHQHGARSCMNDEAGLFDPGSTGPNAADYATLRSVYAHLDGTTARQPPQRRAVIYLRPIRLGNGLTLLRFAIPVRIPAFSR